MDAESKRRFGRQGAKVLKEKVKEDPDFFRRAGALGGQTTKEKYGEKHFREIGRIGGLANRKKRGE